MKALICLFRPHKFKFSKPILRNSNMSYQRERCGKKGVAFVDRYGFVYWEPLYHGAKNIATK